MNSNFDLAGPLAGLFGGIQQGQEEERSRLANLYQDLQNQRFEAETPAKAAEARLAEALAKAKMEGGYVPVAAQAAIKEQQAKLPQLDFSKLRSQADLADAMYSTGTSVEQILPQFGIDPTSATGQAFLKDFPTAMTKFRDKLINLEADTAKQRNALELEKYKGDIDLRKAGIAASAQRDAASRYERGDLIKYSGQLTSEIQNYNTNIAKLEGKEMDAAIVADFVKRNGKEPTPDQVTESKQSFKKQLEQERDALIEQRDSVRGMVGGKLGMKPQGTGTAGNPIKLD